MCLQSTSIVLEEDLNLLRENVQLLDCAAKLALSLHNAILYFIYNLASMTLRTINKTMLITNNKSI